MVVSWRGSAQPAAARYPSPEGHESNCSNYIKNMHLYLTSISRVSGPKGRRSAFVSHSNMKAAEENNAWILDTWRSPYLLFIILKTS